MARGIKPNQRSRNNKGKLKKLITNVVKMTPQYIIADAANKAVRKIRSQRSQHRTNVRRQKQLEFQHLTQTNPEEATMEVSKVVRENLPAFKKVVESSGMELASNPQDIAIQVAQARGQAVQQIMDDDSNIANNVEDANETIDEIEENEEGENYDGEEFETFDPVTIGIITGFAKGAINKIKEKRLAKGKKFLGQTKAQYDAKTANTIDVDAIGESIKVTPKFKEGKTNDILEAGTEGAQREVTKSQLKMYLPIAIGAIALYFLMRKK
jgi:hypothetical protein